MLRTRLLVLVGLAVLPAAAWPQGSPLGPEFQVNTYTAGNQRYPSIAADALGNFVVVWTSDLEDGSGLGIFGQRYASSGVTLGPELRVNSYTTGDQQRPALASDGVGNFVVVWSSSGEDGSSTGVFGQRYAVSGAALGPEFRVNSYTTDNQDVPRVASTPSGDFVVVWQSRTQDGSGYGIFGQRYAMSGVPLGSEFRVNTSTTLSEQQPAVAVNSGGNVVVVWQNESLGGGGGGPPGVGVFGQRYAASGAPLGPEFRVNTYTTYRQGAASVASDPAGNFVVVWTSEVQDGEFFGIFGQRYDAGGAPLGLEFRVNTFTTASQIIPKVASDAAGNFVVVWYGGAQDGSGYGVFGQRYDSSGSPTGPEFRVNSYTTGSQRAPSVTADDAGNFVVAWTSQTQDGSNDGVFGQRYSQIVPVELIHYGVE